MRALNALLFLALTGCGGDCSCGSGGAEQTSEKTGANLPPLPKEAPSQKVLAEWVEPTPDESAKLDAIRAQAAAHGDAGLPAQPVRTTPEKLAAILAGKVARFTAEGDAAEATIELGTATVPVATRHYRDGKRTLYLKITDTSPVPEAARTIIDSLGKSEEAAGTFSRGGLVRGYPGVFSYSPRHLSAKGALLVDGRLLLELRISPGTDPDEPRSVLEALDWSGVAPAQGPAGGSAGSGG